MKNKNAVAVHEWKDDPDCFLRMLNSPAQQRSRAARLQKDADRERFNNVLNAVIYLVTEYDKYLRGKVAGYGKRWGDKKVRL